MLVPSRSEDEPGRRLIKTLMKNPRFSVNQLRIERDLRIGRVKAPARQTDEDEKKGTRQVRRLFRPRQPQPGYLDQWGPRVTGRTEKKG